MRKQFLAGSDGLAILHGFIIRFWAKRTLPRLVAHVGWSLMPAGSVIVDEAFLPFSAESVWLCVQDCCQALQCSSHMLVTLAPVDKAAPTFSDAVVWLKQSHRFRA